MENYVLDYNGKLRFPLGTRTRTECKKRYIKSK